MKASSYLLKRSIKALRNAVVDPYPRRKTLVVRAWAVTEGGLDIFYQVGSEEYKVAVNLGSLLAAKLKEADMVQLSPTLTAVSIAFAPFFFKLTDFEQVLVDSAPMDRESIEFFSKFLQGGLGEFRYLQGLNPARPVILSSTRECQPQTVALASKEHVLMLNGGGKDTIVASELLERADVPYTWLTVNSNKVRRSVISISGNSDSLEMSYELDEQIERCKVYPWGHFPHTSIFVSLGVLAAQLLGIRYVCVGNESSASDGNVTYRGFDVNHQFSKSFEYEEGFSSYLRRSVTGDIEAFSILRPFHDLHLAKIFSNFERYHGSFVSCNRGISRGIWCKDCAKCAFTALALYPFVGAQGMEKIFGEDVMLRPSMRHHILELVDDGVKPWECVGTLDENRLALKLMLERNPSLVFGEAPYREELERVVESVNTAVLSGKILEVTEENHQIPAALRDRLNVVLESLAEPAIR